MSLVPLVYKGESTSNTGKFPVQNMLFVKTPNCQTEFAQRLTVVHLAAAMHVADQCCCSPSLPRFTGMWCKMCCFWWFDVVFGVGCCCGGEGIIFYFSVWNYCLLYNLVAFAKDTMNTSSSNHKKPNRKTYIEHTYAHTQIHPHYSKRLK